MTNLTKSEIYHPHLTGRVYHIFLFKNQIGKNDTRKVSRAIISWAPSSVLYKTLIIACVHSEALYLPGKLKASFIAEGV